MVSILQFPGTNCERDMKYSYNFIGVDCAIVWYKDSSLPKETKLVVIPGGFSYGDYLRSGAIARFSPIMKDVARYARGGGLVLGICNGFQILTESGLLPGALKRNEKLHFISRDEELEVINNDNAFLKDYSIGEKITLPLAHADGSYFIDKRGLESLKENNQILLKYLKNPNGSIDSIAGICDRDRRVFGLMPHPERAIEPLLGGEDGISMLKALVC